MRGLRTGSRLVYTSISFPPTVPFPIFPIPSFEIVRVCVKYLR